MTLFRDDTNKEFILSFRGTSTIPNFISDLNQTLVPCVVPGISCLGCTCEGGYILQYQSVESELVLAVNSGLQAHSDYSLTLTGHSMGGSLASIGAVALRGLGFKLVAYTYGQPRTGNSVYADYVDKVFGGQDGTMYRATHKNDGVPQVPPQNAGYRHHSTEYWQMDDPAEAANTFECEGQEPSDCNQSEPGYGIGDNGIGINLAHLSYFGISIGDPLNTDAACRGIS